MSQLILFVIIKTYFLVNGLDGEDCRQEQGYDEMKGLVGTSWFGHDMCHEYSSCEYDENSQIFRCKCKVGYQGDGFECQIQRGILVNKMFILFYWKINKILIILSAHW